MLSTLALVICTATFVSIGRAEDNDAREILRRATGAMGGEGALARLKSPMMWMERGTYHGSGQAADYIGQYAAKWPHWYRQEIENAVTNTISGEKAWMSTGEGVQNVEGVWLIERLKQVRVAWAVRLFPLKDEAYTLSAIDGIEVDGRATVGIKASHADGRDIKLFFDKQTYLIAKLETTTLSPGHGPDPVSSEVFYSGHRSFGGVTMPSKFKLFYDGELFVEAETIDYKMFATLDPQHFEPPQ
jgi:hypothetical protein